MKKVVIFGAAGQTGKYITEKMKAEKDIELSVFVRNPDKFGDMDLTDVNVIQGDALNADDVEKAMEGQEIMLCSLEGDYEQTDFNCKRKSKKERKHVSHGGRICERGDRKRKYSN